MTPKGSAWLNGMSVVRWMSPSAPELRGMHDLGMGVGLLLVVSVADRCIEQPRSGHSARIFVRALGSTAAAK